MDKPPPKRPASRGNRTPGKPPRGDGKDADLSIEPEVFDRPTIGLPPRKFRDTQPEFKTPTVRQNLRDKDVEATAQTRHSTKAPFERKSPKGPPAFKRFVTHPETAVAATVATDNAMAESVIDVDDLTLSALPSGRHFRENTPTYRPNRLFNVLDSIYVHSPIHWINRIGDGSGRVIITTILLVMVAGLAAWKFGALKGTETHNEKSEEIEIPKLDLSDRQSGVQKVVGNFLKASTVEARATMVIDPERALPRMKEYYNTRKASNPIVEKWEILPPVEARQGEAAFPIVFHIIGNKPFGAIIQETKDGFRLDWENFVAFGDIAWPEFCKARPTTSTAMRVRIQRVENYHNAYPQDRYQSWLVQHRSGHPQLVGYVEKTGRTGQLLDSVLPADQEKPAWHALNLYLHFDPTVPDEKIVVIDDWIRNRWQDEFVVPLDTP